MRTNDNDGGGGGDSIGQVSSVRDGRSSRGETSSWVTDGSVVNSSNNPPSMQEGASSAASRTSTIKSPPRRRARRKNSDQKSMKKSRKNDGNQSIQDRIVNAGISTGTSALFGTVELLKMAGGATLSTTGKLVAPPLRVTKDVLLPSLWTAVKDYASNLTPQRVKDWLRIFSSSMYHFVTVLLNTNSGQLFRERVITMGVDLVDCASSDVSRQVIADTMATFVKFAEAMNTPEAREFIEQSTVLCGRMIDVAAQGRNKQLISDWKLAVFAAIELASDPATTLALAEVTATLCHTLEMEDAIYRKSHLNPKLATALRQQREQYERELYEEPDLMQEPNKTIEEVIVSSLGEPPQQQRGGGGVDSQAGPDNSEAIGDHGGRIDIDDGDYEYDDDDDEEYDDDGEAAAWKNVGQRGVDSKYLKHRIAERAEAIERKRMLRRTITTDGILEASKGSLPKQEEEQQGSCDLEELGTFFPAVEDGRHSKDERPGDQESPVLMFSKRLKEMLEEKRKLALDRIMAEQNLDSNSWGKSASVTNVKGGLDSIRKILNAKEAVSSRSNARAVQIKETLKKSGQQRREVAMVDLFFAGFGLIILFWFLMGCYGVYSLLLFTQTGRLPFSTAPPAPAPTIPDAATREIVIRIVQEVAPTNDGIVVPPVDVDMEKITECIQDAAESGSD